MESFFTFNGQRYRADLTQGIDCSTPLQAGNTLSAWYVEPISIEPVRGDGFTGAVSEGGSVNFRNIRFNPHGHGTHTECYGHITPEVHSVNQLLRTYHHPALLRSIEPETATEPHAEYGIEPGDAIITANQLPDGPLPPAFILRTLPNSPDKLRKAYSNTNPPYFAADAMQKLVNAGVEHLLLDMPSVDRESDGGALRAHHIFWGLPAAPRTHCTITEMVYAPDVLADGLYLLNLQVAPFENDASPSRPVLYPASAVAAE